MRPLRNTTRLEVCHAQGAQRRHRPARIACQKILRLQQAEHPARGISSLRCGTLARYCAFVDATPNSGVVLLLLESGSRHNRYFHLNAHRLPTLIKHRRFTRTHLELDSRCSCALTVRRSDPAYNYIVWACTAVARTTRRPACASTRHTRFQAPSCTLLSMVSHLLSALGLFSNFVLEKTNLVRSVIVCLRHENEAQQIKYHTLLHVVAHVVQVLAVMTSIQTTTVFRRNRQAVTGLIGPIGLSTYLASSY